MRRFKALWEAAVPYVAALGVIILISGCFVLLQHLDG